MFDHLNLPVSNYEASKRFYETVLAPLGHTLIMEHAISGGGFGSSGKPSFWIKQGAPTARVHVAFTANNRASVDEFYTTAISAGAACNGPPGLRPEYHPTYYGAFVLDPDGNNIEAVCHLSE
jgi:catechol 2,3-dioxygenase-like lactoylglutathione lyase family enzyme